VSNRLSPGGGDYSYSVRHAVPVGSTRRPSFVSSRDPLVAIDPTQHPCSPCGPHAMRVLQVAAKPMHGKEADLSVFLWGKQWVSSRPRRSCRPFRTGKALVIARGRGTIRSDSFDRGEVRTNGVFPSPHTLGWFSTSHLSKVSEWSPSPRGTEQLTRDTSLSSRQLLYKVDHRDPECCLEETRRRVNGRIAPHNKTQR
jgi:hypothetical protein